MCYSPFQLKIQESLQMNFIRLVLVFAAGASTLLTINAHAKDCSLAVWKTYMPNAPGKTVCDDKGVPAAYAGDLSTLKDGFATLGYKAKPYDQCANGHSPGTAYSLVSQLGSCVQSGASGTCKLWVAVYNEATNEKIYENTIQASGVGAVTLHISEALDSVAAIFFCPSARVTGFVSLARYPS
jgi:hypothetical protein